jgi:hypothetical protein
VKSGKWKRWIPQMPFPCYVLFYQVKDQGVGW